MLDVEGYRYVANSEIVSRTKVMEQRTETRAPQNVGSVKSFGRARNISILRNALIF